MPQKLTTTACFIQEESSGGEHPLSKHPLKDNFKCKPMEKHAKRN